MGLFQSLSGLLRLELTSADIPGALIAIAEKNIPVYDVRTKGELTLRMEIRREDYRFLADICRKRGEKLRILGRRGLYWTGKNLLKRPLLLIGIGTMLAAVLFLPSRVFFVRVEGNSNVPARQILEAADNAGIRFGASRREVRSERVKNALLQALPSLQWAGVNTSGCVATISVRERSMREEEPEDMSGKVSSIVAVCDGVILSATVTRGTGLCQPGQAVTAGQLLISGYTDLGLSIRADQAEGEIFARTRHALQAITPALALQKGESEESMVHYSLLVGKNRINLWKDSGICGGSCDRMYEEYYVTLPGGFQLPIALVKETVANREAGQVSMSADDAESLLRRFSENYLVSQTISGRIISEDVGFTETDGAFMLEGTYICTEMIGRQRQEKIGE